MKLGRRVFGQLTLLSAAGFATPAWGGPTYKTLTGPFTQERTVGLLRAKVVSRGIVTIVRPDHLRWELLPPDDIVYWVTPEVLAYKSKKGSGRIAATETKLAQKMVDLRALVAGDMDKLGSRYTVTQNGQTVEAVPRVLEGASFRKITTLFTPDLVRPKEITLVEGPKDTTVIRFGTLELDVPVPPETMEPRG